ncbi:ABC-type transport auxiliary lipoprotein family protein [Thiorhodovibrio frisius]|uniref:Uncharacterized protein n=1 Tax=Thiorhodovibrio frisius TaxID=631362 RepID=H8YZA5_9GAMM|nr:ABC-type transport auxiliary lipoprotein family protein [Thiorhodovibrio frisius]EIC22032.1 Protein of unknown function (DUF330) [Thiorhodovibrio frisius]WPL24323.1 ABC-type uncharacterized transport system, auxiliary component [Thiorhodovibrio frisius]
MTKVRLLGRVALALIVVSLISGCAFQAAEPAFMYRLVVTPEAGMDPGSVASRFELMPLRSNRPQGGSLGIMVAEVGEVVRVDEFSAGRWEESPETVLERALVAELNPRVDVAAPRRDSSEGALSHPRLRASLDQFEMVEPQTGGTPYAAVSLSFQLLSPRDRLLLKTGEIQEREPLPTGASLDTVVAGFNRASSRAVSRFVAEVSGLR